MHIHKHIHIHTYINKCQKQINKRAKKSQCTSKIILEEIKVRHTYTYTHLQYLYAKMYICIKCTCEHCSLYVLYILQLLFKKKKKIRKKEIKMIIII